ncbi:MAG TPA: glycosyltransferase family 2 protein [Verrucomicrobiae bacterium]|nr:glycosyltransferase family 2 protein [Verrucomicrobiae bacterium]
MSGRPTFTLFMPTMNEVEGMKAMMPRVNKAWVDEILVVDGGSRDGTLEYAEAEGYRIAHQTKTKGIMGAYMEGLPHVKTDVVIAFSPDGNSLPERIPALVEKMKEGYDMVIVSRYLDGAKSEDDDPVTAFGNWMFTTMINVAFGGHYTDSLVMFRAWVKDSLGSISRVEFPRAGFEPLMSIRCAKEKRKVTEIPGDEPKRIGSARKMDPLKNGMDILRLIAAEKMARGRRP